MGYTVGIEAKFRGEMNITIFRSIVLAIDGKESRLLVSPSLLAL
jgi:hypothetical protein